MRKSIFLGIALILIFECAFDVFALPLPEKEITEEELFFTEITVVLTASKKEKKLSETAAAVYVITQEDIRRSGAASIPEALRMVPGLEVAHIDANKWAITSRGFNGRYSSKLLVLMDGRSLYSPVFSGTYWEAQDTMLEDVDRIEVIRGPGATLWGANAVNGVINIITNNTKNTQGGMITAGGGDEERGFGGFRYGGKVGEDANFKVYAKYFNRDEFADESGNKGADAWDVLRGGFRIDWDISDNDALTLQGDIYDGGAGHTSTHPQITPPYSKTFHGDTDFSGRNVLSRWKRSIAPQSEIELQFYYDGNEHGSQGVGRVKVDTIDLDFHHSFALVERHSIIWGLGYRFNTMNFDSTFAVSVAPESRDDHLFSVFIQDEISVIKDRLNLTLGSKFEHNNYTGFEIQPNCRLVWTPVPRHTVWGSISRAVRTPSWFDHERRINFLAFPGSSGLTNLMATYGDTDVESEVLFAYEIGYRLQPTDRFYIDISTFLNDYHNLLTSEPGAPFFESTSSTTYLVFPLRSDNKMDGETYGVEVAANWEITDSWKLMASYSWLEIQLHMDPSSGDTSTELRQDKSPRHQFHLRSYLSLPMNLELDSALYYVGALPAFNVSSYVRFDARLGWRPTKALEFSIIGKNLSDNKHLEYGLSEGVNPMEVERSVYGKITWRF